MLWMISRLGPALTALALVVVLSLNLAEIGDARATLEKTRDQLATETVAEAKVESQLERLAQGVQGLANQGDPNAQRIMAELKAAGVTIKGS